MSKIEVPEGMLKAVVGSNHQGHIPRVLEAALQWLSDNPIVPTDEQWNELREWDSQTSNFDTFFRHVLAEWQRRMFLAPEPEIPEEVKDLLMVDPENTPVDGVWMNKSLIEAFRRGKRSKG